MRRVRQTVVADPRRRDGYNAAGIPGDCLRAAVASLTGLPLDAVPHFGLFGASWWQVMRRWARTRGDDFACVRPHHGSVEYAIPDYHSPTWTGFMIGGGPSPRGPWRHVVVVDRRLTLVHDPHPSDRGVVRVDEVFVLCPPYDDGLAPQWQLADRPWRCPDGHGRQWTCGYCDEVRELILAGHDYTGPQPCIGRS